MAVINGTMGADSLVGTEFDDTIQGMDGNDTIYGGGGNDFITQFRDQSTTYTVGQTYIDGGEGDNIINAGTGNNSPNWNYTIHTGSGNDSISVGSQAYVDAGNGDNYITIGMSFTNPGTFSEVHAGSGNDTIQIGVESALVYGGDGHNEIAFREGGDKTYYGGSGDDIVSAAVAFNRDGSFHIYLGDGNNQTSLNALDGPASITAGSGNDNLIGSNGPNQIHSGAGNDTITGGHTGDFLDGGAGNDLLNGGDGGDQFLYTSGNDTIGDFQWYADHIEIHQGAAFDTYQEIMDAATQVGSNVVITFSPGNSLTLAGVTKDYLFQSNFTLSSEMSNDGNDTFMGTSAAETLHGGIGNDSVNGLGGNDFVYGDDGNDTVRGGLGNDYVDGGAGNDAIWGDPGNDTLVGGAGPDRFFFISGYGHDQVLDFNYADGDRIRLDVALSVSTIADDTNGDAVITTNEGSTITLVGHHATEVQSGWIGL